MGGGGGGGGGGKKKKKKKKKLLSDNPTLLEAPQEKSGYWRERKSDGAKCSMATLQRATWRNGSKLER